MTSFFQTITLFATSLIAADAASIELHPVPIPAKSPRLLGMSMDDDGFIWLGSTHRRIYRYDPRSAAAEEIPLPFDSSTSQCICVGTKVYLLGQTYPKTDLSKVNDLRPRRA
jgi:sugar lactone lactonase YvrE